MAVEHQRIPPPIRPATTEHITELHHRIDLLDGKQKTDRQLIKALCRRLDRLERGDPPDPQRTPPALRAEEV